MHPLRHPRNAALVGIMFVVIGVHLLGGPRRSAAGTSTTPGTTHAHLPRRGDGDHGLRPGRRIQRTSDRRRVAAARDLSRPTDARTDLDRLPRPDGAVRHARLGQAHRARLPVGIVVLVVLLWPARGSSGGSDRPRPPAAASGGSRRRRRPASTCPARRSPRSSRRSAPFLLLLGLVFGGLDARPRRDRARPDPALLAGRGPADLRPRHRRRPRRPCPAVVHDGPPPGVHMPGPSWRPFLGALGVFAAVARPGVRRAGCWRSASSPSSSTLVGWLVDAVKEYRQDGRGRPDRPPREHRRRRGTPSRLLTVLAVLIVGAAVLQSGVFATGRPSGGTAGASGASAAGARPRRRPRPGPAPGGLGRPAAARAGRRPGRRDRRGQGHRLRRDDRRRRRRASRSRSPSTTRTRARRTTSRSRTRPARSSSRATSSTASRPGSTTSRRCRPARTRSCASSTRA